MGFNKFKIFLLLFSLTLFTKTGVAPAQDTEAIEAFKLKGPIFLKSQVGTGCNGYISPSSNVNILLVRQGDTIYTTSYGLRRASASGNSATFKFQPNSKSEDVKSLKTKLAFKKLHLNKVSAVFTYTTNYQDNSTCQLIYEGTLNKKDSD